MNEFFERITKLPPKKLALLAMELRSKLDRAEQQKPEPIAIVGMGCRVPGGANDPEAFWELLRDGVDATSEIPADRWDVDRFFSEDPEEPGKMYTRRGGFLDGLDKFDPHFFSIAPREAATLDPQQRLLLEVSWEALEHAGQPIDSLFGTQTGVFVGISSNDYLNLQTRGGDLTRMETYVGTGNASSVAAGRLSYILGVHGPAVSIDTACSSSLVALHFACQSLSAGECRLALAGGVNVILGPEANVVLSRARMLAPDGRCKTFDASADGFGRSDGCGVVVLKRLSDARADGDRILAVIRATAVNQDGRSSGITAPNGVAQEALLRQALAKGGVEPAQVSYIEAHGTGTTLGDPIEVLALSNVLREGRPKERPIVVGSVKANIGHLEAAAGIAGLIKVVLALQHDEIPPHIHFKTPNPHIPWSELPIVIPTAAMPWPENDGLRIAGVSSFGFSGTNAHILLEAFDSAQARSAPASEPAAPVVERPLHALTLSARTEPALDALVARFDEFLAKTEESIADVCYSANAGRGQFQHRLAVVGATADEIRGKLTSGTGVIRGKASGAVAPTVAFLFTGQGSQWAGMGRELYETQPIFRAAIDRCAAALASELPVPLLDVLYPNAGTQDASASSALSASASSAPSASLVDETQYTQPALFALEWALSEVWKAWGVTPAVVLGHSIGEYVAACVAGVFSVEDALKLVAARGRLMQALPAGGTMAAVAASEAVVTPALAGTGVALAAVNGPASVVVAGPAAAVTTLCARWTAAGIKTQALTVSHAFHSALMEPMLDAFEAVAATVTYHRPTLGVISNVTGRRASAEELMAPGYWRRHVRATVQFAAGLAALGAEGATVFVEVGPAPTLTALGQACLPDGGGVWAASLRKDGAAWKSLLEAVATVAVRGVEVRWKALDAEWPRRKVALPTYPFQRERFWLEKVSAHGAHRAAEQEGARHPLLGRRIPSPLKDVIFEQEIGLEALPFLGDHRVHGAPVFPATAALEAFLGAADETFGQSLWDVEQLSISEPLHLTDDRAVTVQVIVKPDGQGGSFQLFSRGSAQTAPESAARDDSRDEWRLHATATLRPASAAPQAPELLDTLRRRCADEQPVDEYYAVLRDAGMDYGPAFRGVVRLWRGDGEALAEIELPAAAGDHSPFRLHPALSDACFQIVGAALPAELSADPDAVYMLVDIDRMRLAAAGALPAWSHVRVRGAATPQPETLVADLRLFDPSGAVVGEVEGLRLKRASRSALRRTSTPDARNWLYELAWVQKGRPASTAEPRAGTWIVPGAGELADAVRLRLARDGARVINDAAWLGADEPLAGVVDLRPVEAASDDRTFAAVDGAVQRTCRELLTLAQTVVRSKAEARPGIWIVTRGANAIDGSVPSVAQAPVWGFARTLRLEHPDIRCVCVDLDPRRGDGEIEALAAEISGGDADDQVAFRESRRYVARLRRAAKRASTTGAAAVRLGIASRGILDNLEVQPLVRRAPGPGEVEIQVAASGLNFRDVLNALGMYPGDAGLLGNECVGRIVRVGEGVSGLEVGQDVVAMGSGTFASFVTTIAEYVAPKPARLNADEAATIPVTFLTADYALNRLGRMRAGERVLIHAAAGGVGLAAVQLAKRAGAEIFATAGSDEKRAYLESLGIRHVMSSRTLDFADEIKRRTNGRGVDLVLNSLAGEFIDKSVGCLANGGRFLEIGKTGIWTADQMKAVRPDVGYHAIYLGDVDHAEVQSMMRDLSAAFDAGTLAPLPYRVFPLDAAASAFRFMAQAKHIGKIVIAAPAAPNREPARIRADASYLVTGGLGALGLRIARGLVDAGARHLVLMGRRVPDEAARSAIAALEGAGARVKVAQGDVAKRDDVASILDRIAAEMPPLKGIVHSAGVLADGVVAEQDWTRFSAALAPKIAGAWHLHELTARLTLDFFVLFSSTASIFGSPGQVNYASANAFLDALAHRRAADGLPALSINWGPWADGGMAASLGAQDRRRVGRTGLLELTPDQGVSAFLQVLDHPAPQVTVLAADWKTVASAAGGDVPAYLSELVRTAPAPRTAAAREGAAAELPALLERTPAVRRASVVQAHVRAQVVQVLGLDPASPLDPQQGLRDLGMDSLMAVELRNRLQKTVGRPLPSTLAFDCPTVEALSGYLVKDVLKLSAVRDEEVPAAGVRKAAADEPIAIVGLGVRLPGDASTPEKYWDLLRGGVDAIAEVPPDRWDIDAYYDPDPAKPGKMYTRFGGFLRDVDRFDPAFFGISPREAVSLDPQQRLLLEVSWEALERAGQAPEKLVGTRSGVFVGISTQDYAGLFAKLADPSRLDAYVGTGNSLSVAAGRLSYVLGLQGPSMAVDTACSSSLVAIHLACSSLRNGECELALAGGVNLILTPELTINFCRARMLAADGRCKSFDAAADGYVRGEGAGMVVLKRLSDALAAGDRILAVIRGSAVNQDGRSSGLTVPNGPAQQALLREALAAAGVTPADVGYIEAHGTGTSLGDPIEMQAVAEVFGAGRSPEQPLVVGSVKTNFGHLEAAAGIAGLAKVVLALEHGEIPPHLHFSSMNPHIETGGAPIVIPTAATPWPSTGRRVAGVSSFGFGGTNAHIVLEAFDSAQAKSFDSAQAGPASSGQQAPASASERPAHIVTLSARSAAALSANAARLGEALAADPSIQIGDVAVTLNEGRSHFSHRAAIVAADAVELAERLEAIAAGSKSPSVAVGAIDGDEAPPIAFLFTGQGSQYAGMARRLYETEPTFRTELDRCDALLAPYLGRSIVSIVFGTPELLGETQFTQPALFAVEWALAQLWQSWGIHPTAVLGHSLGEYVAATVAGVFSLEDGLKLAATRGRLMQALQVPGAMAAVFAEEAIVQAAIEPHAAVVSVAAVNGPDNVVISGATAVVDDIVEGFRAMDIRAQRLDVSHAFHSPLVEPMLDELERIVAASNRSAPRIPVVSNLSGRVAADGELESPAYWRRHAREAVRFSDGIAALREQGCRVFLEIGPSPTLLGMARRVAVDDVSLEWLPSLRKGRDDREQVLDTLASLYVHGVPIDWTAFGRGHAGRKIVLPTYAFQRERYWIEEQPAPRKPARAAQPFDDAVEAGERQSLQGPLDLALHTYDAKWTALERITTGYMIDAFHKLGVFKTVKERHTIDTIVEQCGLLPSYRKPMARWFDRLTAEGILARDGDAYVAPAGLPDPGLDAIWAEAQQALSDMPYLIDYIRRSGDAVVRILRGQESALAILFPGGNVDGAEALYERSGPSRYMNAIARAVAAAFASARATERQVNVLELGAGTGGTSSAVIPGLPRSGVTYWFTDLSDFFLGRAAQKFKAYDFIRYGLLNIENDPETQGYRRGAFDVILAANVLHATIDLRRTLEHARSLLAPGGILLLLEDTVYHSYFDITVALIDGWQRFEDDLRGDHPLIAVDVWNRALHDAGFERVATFPRAGTAGEIIGQTIIIATPPVTEGVAEAIGLDAGTGVAAFGTGAAEGAAAEDLRARVADALPSEREDLLVTYVREHVAGVLRLRDASALNRRQRLMDLGLDSLMAVELRNRLAAGVGSTAPLPATLMFDYPTIEAIALYLGRLLETGGRLGDAPQAVREDADAAARAAAAARIAELSEEETEALLLEKLENL